MMNWVKWIKCNIWDKAPYTCILVGTMVILGLLVTLTPLNGWMVLVVAFGIWFVLLMMILFDEGPFK
jgi:hypothetical protein